MPVLEDKCPKCNEPLYVAWHWWPDVTTEQRQKWESVASYKLEDAKEKHCP